MTLPQLPETQRELRLMSEQFQGSAAKLYELWTREIELYARDNPDAERLRRLIEDVDAILPTLAEISDCFAVIARPATEVEIGDHLAIMRMNFHNSKAAGGYANIMVDRAIAKAPSFAAIEWATREVIDTKRFLPVTAELLDTICGAQDDLNRMRHIIASLPARRSKMAKQLAEMDEHRASVSRRIANRTGESVPT